MKKINNVTSLMMENGFNEFYKSFEKFNDMIYIDYHTELDDEYIEDGDNKLQAMGMQQLKRAMIYILFLYGFAFAVLLFEKSIEIIVALLREWKKWRNRKSIDFQFDYYFYC